MSFKKQDIYKVLETITAPGEGKSLIENKNVTNVVTFGNEVLLDIVISNPTLQAKKKLESEITRVLISNIDSQIEVKINVKVQQPEIKEKTNQICAIKMMFSCKNTFSIYNSVCRDVF